MMPHKLSLHFLPSFLLTTATLAATAALLYLALSPAPAAAQAPPPKVTVIDILDRPLDHGWLTTNTMLPVGTS